MLRIKRSWRETTALAGRLCVFANETLQEFSPKRAGSPPSLLSLAVLLITLGGGIASVQAQQQVITLIPGLTPPQAAIGRAIETLCPPLAMAPAGTPFTP